MKPRIIPAFLVLVSAFASCTTAYKSGQTPDDVYYSAARPQEEDIRKKEEREDYTYNDQYYDDRYLRMKVRNRYRWNDLNEWYSYDRYSFGYNYAWGSYYNPYNSWNYYYNPYCCCHGNYAFSNPKVVSIRPIVKPHNFNLGGYTNTAYNNSNTSANGKSGRTSSSRPAYNNSNNNSNNGKDGFSNTIRTIFSRNENNNNSGSSGSSSSGNSRTYTPSSSSGSSSSGSSSSSGGSSGGGVSRPGRN